jgi:hypothetical protein
METSVFRSTLNRELSTIYPAVFEITGGIPEPIFISSRRLGRILGKMTCLNWKSDAPATVIHRYRKGTGYPPKRHCGVIF